MGVNHAGDEGTGPPEFGVGDANANCPPQILSYRYKKERPVASTSKTAPDPSGGADDAPQTT